jgi:uncharacterized cupin superfamily protein
MSEITVESNPSQEKLDHLGVSSWPIWTKEVSEFPWYYDDQEQFLVLEGHVIVTPEGGEPVEINVGDFVTCPAGMSCTWQVLEPIRKHYNFG